MKKLISITLLLSLLCTVGLFGCKKEEASESESTVNTVQTVDDNEGFFKTIRDDLPETMDFGGKVIKMICRSNERFFSEFNTETGSSSVLGDALYERILNIESRLNVKVDICPDSNSTHGPWEELSTSIQSGACDYHVAAGGAYRASNYAMQGEYRNLRNLENINLEKGYWSQGMIDNLTVAGATYFATGSISTYFYDSTYVMYVNKDLAESYQISVDELYNSVSTGEWTLDKMINISKDIYSDNGDGIEGDGDVYGFGLQVSSATDGFWSAFNIQNTEVASDGAVKYMLDVDKVSTVVKRLNDFLWNSSGTVALAESDQFASENVYTLENQFANDKLVFVTDLLYRTSTATMRDMKSDYGVLPYPKYDTEQEEYYSFAHDQMTIFAIPLTVSNNDIDAVSAFLEVMASEGHNTVMPTYYEKVLTTRNVRDPESVEILQGILSSVNNDRSWFFNYATGRINNIILREQIWHNTNEVSSTYRENYQQVNEKLLSVKDSFAKHSGN